MVDQMMEVPVVEIQEVVRHVPKGDIHEAFHHVSKFETYLEE